MNRSPAPLRVVVLSVAALLLLPPAPAPGVDLVTVERDGRRFDVAGEVLVTAADGGILLRGRDGALWNILPEEQAARRAEAEPFTPLTHDELAEQLKRELPGFETYSTQHYLIVYNTSKAYAQWCGGLFERLYGAFTTNWKRRGFKLEEPRFPLVALVFADEATYKAHATPELGAGVDSIIGYYSLKTNRVTMHDLTGVAALRLPGAGRATSAQINRLLAQPGAEFNVATIVHEATHQIAFNCGLHQRYADIPLWVSEGVACYFETPDLESATGWRTVGGVNGLRLRAFRAYLAQRPAGSLETLIASDERFRNGRTQAEAYAEAWALNYFLLKMKGKQYEAYLEGLQKKGPLEWDEPAERLAEFRAAFGLDLAAFDAEFIRYMARVR